MNDEKPVWDEDSIFLNYTVIEGQNDGDGYGAIVTVGTVQALDKDEETGINPVKNVTRIPMEIPRYSSSQIDGI